MNAKKRAGRRGGNRASISGDKRRKKNTTKSGGNVDQKKIDLPERNSLLLFKEADGKK